MKSIPNPSWIAKGDFVVSSNHGHKGLVYDICIAEPNDEDWFDLQNIQPTPEQKTGVWVSILIDGGGAVYVALDTISLIEPIKGFTHTGDQVKVEKLLSN